MRRSGIIMDTDPAQLERARRLGNLMYTAWHHRDPAIRERATGLLAEVYAESDDSPLPETALWAKSAA